MAWSIFKTSELPLGKRILRLGSSGADVCELQKLLKEAGFYFGGIDGFYGALTKKAILLLQRVYHLKIDGIAGPEVLKVLNHSLKMSGRIIYTIKAHEDLRTISQKFSVTEASWQGVPGQGNPRHKTYPGMRLLLHEKALFTWSNFSGRKETNGPVTGIISPGWRIEKGMELKNLVEEYQRDRYYLIEAEAEILEELFSFSANWGRLVNRFKKQKNLKIGFDLRNAPLNTIHRWTDFFRYISANYQTTDFLILPVPCEKKGIINQLYWLNLPTLFRYTGLVMLEPLFDYKSPISYQNSLLQIPKYLLKSLQQDLSGKTLLVSSTSGWDWNLNQNTGREISYREARIVRAINYRFATYSPPAQLVTVDYQSRGERHSLLYRDEEGWRDFLRMVIKLNLRGIVIRNFQDLGATGYRVIADSFAVLNEGGMVNSPPRIPIPQ